MPRQKKEPEVEDHSTWTKRADVQLLTGPPYGRTTESAPTKQDTQVMKGSSMNHFDLGNDKRGLISSCENSWAGLAAMCNVDNTLKARMLFQEPWFRRISGVVIGAKESHYCAPSATKIQVSTSSLFNLFENSRTYQERFSSIMNRDINKQWSLEEISNLGGTRIRQKLKDSEFPVWIYAHAVIALFKNARGDVFLPKLQEDSRDPITKMTPDEVTKCYWILKGFMYQHDRGFKAEEWGLKAKVRPSNLLIYRAEKLDEGEKDFKSNGEEKAEGGSSMKRFMEGSQPDIDPVVEEASHKLASYAGDDIYRATNQMDWDNNVWKAAEKFEGKVMQKFYDELHHINLPSIPEESRQAYLTQLFQTNTVDIDQLPSHLASPDLTEDIDEIGDRSAGNATLFSHLSGQEDFDDERNVLFPDEMTNHDERQAAIESEAQADLYNKFVQSRGDSVALSPLRFVSDKYYSEQGSDILDTADPSERRTLLPWQQIGAAKTYEMYASSDLNGLVIAYGCGLGKTVTCFETMRLINRIHKDSLDESKPCKPFLILAPNATINVWALEYQKYFQKDFVFHIYSGNKNTVNPSSLIGSKILTTDELIDGLYQEGGIFNENNPEARRQIIWSSYQTWSKRTLYRTHFIEKEVAIAVESLKNGETISYGAKKQLVGYEKVPVHNRARYIAIKRLTKEKRGRGVEKTSDHPNKAYLTSQNENSGPRDYDNESDDDIAAADINTELDFLSDGEESMQIFADCFRFLGLDEAHYLKNRDTATNMSVRGLTGFRMCMSATILSNTPGDLTAILELIYPPSRPSNISISDKVLDLVALYNNSEISDIDKVNPDLYRSLLSTNQVDLNTAFRVLPAIYRAAFINLSSGNVLDKETFGDGKIRVGGAIPDFRIFSIFVKPTPVEREGLYRNWMGNIPLLKAGTSQGAKLRRPIQSRDRDSAGAMNWTAYRSMQSAAFNAFATTISTTLQFWHAQTKGAPTINAANNDPKALKIAQEAGDKVGAITALATQKDGGATLLFSGIMTDRVGCVEMLVKQPFHALKYLTKCSPKLRTLAGILVYHVLNRKEKLLISTEIPMTCWQVEIFLKYTGIQYTTIKANILMNERNDLIAEFNDPKNPKMVLLSNSRLIGTGQNLHTACHVTAILEQPRNVGELLQFYGRTVRQGQEHKCTIYNISTENSFDEKIIAQNIRKNLGIALAGIGDSFLETPRGKRLFSKAVNEIAGDDTSTDVPNVTLDELDEKDKRQVLSLISCNIMSEELGFPPNALNIFSSAYADIGLYAGGKRIMSPAMRMRSLQNLELRKGAHYNNDPLSTKAGESTDALASDGPSHEALHGRDSPTVTPPPENEPSSQSLIFTPSKYSSGTLRQVQNFMDKQNRHVNGCYPTALQGIPCSYEPVNLGVCNYHVKSGEPELCFTPCSSHVRELDTIVADFVGQCVEALDTRGKTRTQLFQLLQNTNISKAGALVVSVGMALKSFVNCATCHPAEKTSTTRKRTFTDMDENARTGDDDGSNIGSRKRTALERLQEEDLSAPPKNGKAPASSKRKKELKDRFGELGGKARRDKMTDKEHAELVELYRRLKCGHFTED